MRFSVLLILLILCAWSCETKKRRRQNRKNGSKKQLDSGYGLTSSDRMESGSSLSDSRIPSKSDNENLRRRKMTSRRNRNRNKSSRKSRRKKENSKGSRSQAVLDLLEERRKETLRDTMRHMFGFEHMDSPRVSHEPKLDVKKFGFRDSKQQSRESLSRSLFSSLRHDSASRDRFLPNPPDFMLELYRTYSEDKSLMLVKSQSQGDTVRSFFSVAGESPDQLRNKGKPMIILPYFKGSQSTQVASSSGRFSRPIQMRVFAFNVTSIPFAESIVTAELRLNGLRNLTLQSRTGDQRLPDNSSHLQWTAVLAAYKVADAEQNQTRNVYQRLSELVTIRPNSSFSWVNPDIARLATIARQPGCLFIVKFNHFDRNPIMRRRRNAVGPIPNHHELDTLTSRDSSPILPSYFVVLSDRSKRNSGHRRVTSPTLTPILIVYCNDTTAEPSPAADPSSSNDILKTLQSLNVSTNPKRFRRSPGSKLPGDSLMTSNDNNENELPGESGRQTASRSFTSTHSNDQTELRGNDGSDRRAIQSLKDRKSLSRKRKNKKRKCGRRCRKRCRKGGKSRKCRNGGASIAVESSLNRVQQTCGRKSLHVDFGDMGWKNWIISPKSFDAYYCSGLCQFDTMKKASPSNHAIIQAFIKAFGINSEVPAPCCVPDKLMSLSVLYYDKDDNVVLKVFPNMSVKSCACR